MNKDAQTSRKTEATEIIKKCIAAEVPEFVESEPPPTLGQCLAFLQTRFQTEHDFDESRRKELKLLQSNLREFVESDLLEKVCEDKIIFDILIELTAANISSSEIIIIITDNKNTKSEPEVVPQLIKLNYSQTNDETAFASVIPENVSDESRHVQFSDRPSETVIDAINPMINTDTKTPSTANPYFQRHSTPLSSQARQTQNFSNSFQNLTISPIRNVSIKDAVLFIPMYSGFNIPCHVFIDGLRSAADFLPKVNEPDLAKLVKMRLSGEALKSMHGKNFTSIDEIAKFLDKLFGSSKGYNQLSGELAALKQKQSENVVTFSNRVKTTSDELYEAANRENRLHSKFKEQLEIDKVKSFIRGCHWVIKARLGNFENLEKATTKAIEIERDFALQEPDELTQTVKILANAKDSKSSPSNINRIETKVVEICQICKKQNHSAINCWFRNNGEGQSPVRATTNRQTWIGNKPENRNHALRVDDSRPGNSRNSENRYSSETNSPNTRATENPNDKSDRVCNYCKSIGHWKQECKKLEYVNKKRVESENVNGFSEQGATRETSRQQRQS